LSGNRRRLVADYDDGEELEADVEKSLSTRMSVIEAVNDFDKDLEYCLGENAADDPWKDPIIFYVGETHLSTTLDTLRSENGTFFEKIFHNAFTTTCNAHDTFFIDSNPKTFEYVWDFIRGGGIVLESADRNYPS